MTILPHNLLKAGLFALIGGLLPAASANAVGLPPEEVAVIATAAAEKCGEEIDTATLIADIEKGTAIALASEEYDQGFGDSEADMHMVLYNRHGETSERELRQRSLENPALDMGDKSLIVFDRPRDVAGTTMLTYAKILESDDQWMFLPALKRVKRISSSNKSGPFMGSEFAFEDFSSQEFGKYVYRFLREEACPGEEAKGLTCDVVERYPLYESSGYVKQISWTDREHRSRKVDYYNRRCDNLKSLTMGDYKQYLDHYWRAHKLHMVNHLTGKATDLVWTNFAFNVGLTDDDFSQNSLERAR